MNEEIPYAKELIMNKKSLSFLFLIPLCAGLFSCGTQETSSASSEGSSEESFPKSVKSTLVEGNDYIAHDGGFDFKWEYNTEMWYVNNLDKVPLPDPQVYVEDGVYYIVGTDDASSCKVTNCYYTRDFVTFEKKTIFSPNSFAGGWENKTNATIYAPEMYKVGDKYYLYYSAVEASSGHRRNSVVWANNPLGPYEPIVTGSVDGLHNPLFKYDEQSAVLDSTLFIDDDGEMYMYYSWSRGDQQVWGVKLTSPYEADWSTRKIIVNPGKIDNESTENVLEWEYKYRDGYCAIAEGPFMLKSKGKYYMTYSINGCWNKYYDVCYAVSDSPLGLFTKPYEEGEYYSNLLMGVPCSNEKDDVVFNQWSGFHSGTGHHCFFNIGDQIMIGYHAHKNRNFNSSSSGWVARYFAMDPLYFDNEGVPFVNGPTFSPQPLPVMMSGYDNIAPKATLKTVNVTNERAINDSYVVDCYNLPQEEGKEVGLGIGFSFIELKFDKEYEIGGLSIYNSSDYFKMIYDISYVYFSNGDAFINSSFSNTCVNYDYEFVFPCGAFSYEFKKEIKASSVLIAFNSTEPLAINEVQVLAK